MEKLSIFGGTGFIGGSFSKLHPEKSIIIPRKENHPLADEVLYLISTTHNYNVFTDVHLDINTNLNKLMDVLPNVKGTFNFVSSWFVYGDGYDSPERAALEISPCNPRGFYSITKRAAECLVMSYCETNGINYRIMRLCNVIGGDKNAGAKKNAMEFLLKKVAHNDPIDIYLGDNFRNYIHVDDVVNAINLIIEKGELNSVYNIGANNSDRLVDIIEFAKLVTDSKSIVNFIEAPKFHQIVQTKDFFMNTNKLKELGYSPTYETYEAINMILSGLR